MATSWTEYSRRWAAWRRRNPGANLFFGVATRRNDKGATKEFCNLIATLWTDIDFKDIREPEARKLLENAPIRPSIIVHSGNGLHCYWPLKEPLDAIAERDIAEGYLSRLAEYFHGDPAVAHVAAVLRVPGTSNHKYDPPRPVTIESRESYDYSLSDFSWLPELPKCQPPDPREPLAGSNGNRESLLKRARAYLAAIPPAIEGQHGDEHTFQVCCRMTRGFDLTEGEAFDLLSEWNAGCCPPWTERELQAKIEGARKYGEEPIGALAQEHVVLPTPSRPAQADRDFRSARVLLPGRPGTDARLPH